MAAKKTKQKKMNKKVDIEGLLRELQAKLNAVEEKLDTLISRTAVMSRVISTERDPDFKTRATVTKNFSIPQDRDPRERKMYKVICADCKQQCEVPFMPKANRPVYCKTCFSNRRNKNAPRNLPDREELVAEIAKTLNINVSEPAKSETGKPRKPGSKISKAKTRKVKAKK